METPMIDQLIADCENPMIAMRCEAELAGLKQALESVRQAATAENWTSNMRWAAILKATGIA